MRSQSTCRCQFVAALLFTFCANASAECTVYDLRIRDGLKQGQSISVRWFNYRQPVRYAAEPMPDLQKYLADELMTHLAKLQRFGSIATIPDLEPARTDLVMEGVLTKVDEGAFGPYLDRGTPGSIQLEGAIRSTAKGEEVLVFTCSHRRLPTILPPLSGKSLVHSIVNRLAEDISAVVTTSDREPTRYYFKEEKLVDRDAPVWTSASVAWRSDGRFVAAGGEDGVIRIWDSQTHDREAKNIEHAGTVLSIGWSPDGKRLASASRDKTVRIWEWFEGEPMTRFAVLRGHSDDVLSVAWSPDGKRLASAGKDQTVRLWEADWGARSTVLAGHKGAVRAVAWSPDGARLASCGDDGLIRIWDSGAGREQAALRGHQGKAWDVAWNPDGSLLASTGEDQTLRVWTAATREQNFVIKVDTHVHGRVSWSADGTRLLTAERNLARLWDAASGTEIRTVLRFSCAEREWIGPVPREISCMGAVSFSPDGARIAVAGKPTLIRELYETASQ